MPKVPRNFYLPHIVKALLEQAEESSDRRPVLTWLATNDNPMQCRGATWVREYERHTLLTPGCTVYALLVNPQHPRQQPMPRFGLNLVPSHPHA